jgi:pyrroline-5-carboxylate reductase
MRSYPNIGIIGLGHIGMACVQGWSEKGSGLRLYALDRHAEQQQKAKVYGVTICEDFQDLMAHCSYIVLAVRPKQIIPLLKQIQAVKGEGSPALISLAAGLGLASLKQHYPAAKISRCMPNISMACGEGVLALQENDSLGEEHKKTWLDVFSLLGKIFWLKTDHEMHLCTALAGSGPAFVLFVLRQLAQSSIKLGLESQLAEEMIVQTALGICRYQQLNRVSMSKIIGQIATEGGTTAKGIDQLQQSEIECILQEVVKVTSKRAFELDQLISE